MDYVKIGGTVWDVDVKDVVETFTILYSDNTGRTISPGAKMTLDPLGTFYGHRVTFLCKKNRESIYDMFFEYVSVPRRDGIPVEIVHGQKTISYDAYISTGERPVKRINKQSGKVYWDKLTLNIVPLEAQVKPA